VHGHSCWNYHSCLDLLELDKVTGAAVGLSTCTCAWSQQWDVLINGQLGFKGDGFITHCLDGSLGAVELWPCNGGRTQMWTYDTQAKQLQLLVSSAQCLSTPCDFSNKLVLDECWCAMLWDLGSTHHHMSV